jgi:hypothetical protein
MFPRLYWQPGKLWLNPILSRLAQSPNRSAMIVRRRTVRIEIEQTTVTLTSAVDMPVQSSGEPAHGASTTHAAPVLQAETTAGLAAALPPIQENRR